MYDLTNFTNANNVYEVTRAAHQLSGGWFGTMIIISLFAILFINFILRYPVREALLTTSMITAIIAIVLRAIGLVNDVVMIASIILVGISFAVTFLWG